MSYLTGLIVYPDSALRSALDGQPSGEEWDLDRELLAQAVDALNVLAHGYQRSGKPKAVDRPDLPQVHGGRRVSSAAEIDSFFGGG